MSGGHGETGGQKAPENESERPGQTAEADIDMHGTELPRCLSQLCRHVCAARESVHECMHVSNAIYMLTGKAVISIACSGKHLLSLQ